MDETGLRLTEWVRWLDDAIESDVLTMHLQRSVWKRMQEIAKENQELGATSSYWWDWSFDLYAKTQAQAVRRQSDKDRRAGCLARIMIEIGNEPELVTREWWLDLVANEDESAYPDEEDRRYWRRVYEDHWRDSFGGGDCFDPAIAEADLAHLQDESQKVRDYVNKHVAHLDASVIGGRSKGELPTLDEVHEAVDLVGEYFNKYSFLLRNKNYHDLTPVLQHDWEAVFRIPWIEPTEHVSERMMRHFREREAAEEEAL